jgi:hypothetical protein
VPGRLTRLAVVALGLGAAAASAVATPAPAGPATAQSANQALVVVETGSDRFETYISFTSEPVSGLEALQMAGMSPVYRSYGSNGLAVCALCGRGCPADGSCLTCDEPNYWAYWRDDAGGGEGFVYSGSGAGSIRVGDGDIEGWRWGTGAAPAWEPFDPPQPTTTTTAPPPTTTSTTAAPPPTTTPTTARPPATSPPTSAGGDQGSPGPSTPLPGSGATSPTSAPGPSSTSAPPSSGPSTSAPASSSTSPGGGSSTTASSGSATTGDGPAGVRAGSTSAPSSAEGGQRVDGAEVAAIDAPAVHDAGGGTVRSLLVFLAVLGILGAAIVRVRLARRAAPREG